jgi:hypothetical protein
MTREQKEPASTEKKQQLIDDEMMNPLTQG